jgi:cytoskeleton protein RodZ
MSTHRRAVSENQSMGTYLRAARRRRRISIERAAEETKIRSDFLMRMESDEFDFLAPAYVRGFIRTYARYLRVDPEPLIEEFDRRFGGRVDTAQIIATQRRPSRRRRGLREPRQVNSWVVASVIALGLLVTLAVIGMLQDRPGGRPRTTVAEDDETPPSTDTAEPEGSPTATPEETPEPEPEETEPAIAFDDGIELVIDARYGDCWTQVYTDGGSDPIFSETIPIGSTETFSAEDEMTVLMGLPKSVVLKVNGQKIGSPGGVDPVTIKLPEDVENL